MTDQEKVSLGMIVKMLEQRDKAIQMLRDEAGMDMQEIAERLDMPEATVRYICAEKK